MRSKTGRSLKKFLSFLLTLSMVLGMLPTFALAGDLGTGTAKHLSYTFDLLPHSVLKSDSPDTTDVDAVITIYGDGHSSVDELDLTVKLSVTPTSPSGTAREVTLENVSGDGGNNSMTTTTVSASDFTVQNIDGAIVVTIEKVMTGVRPADTIAADFKVTVGGADVVTAPVSEKAGLDVKHLLNDGSLYAAVTYDAPPTPIGKTVDLLTYVDIYTNAGGGNNATFSLKLGTDDATISKVNYATNGMITNSLHGYKVVNPVDLDVDVDWHRAGDPTVKNVLRSRGSFEWQTTLNNLVPGYNAVSYILDEEGDWYNKAVGDITVHVPTCAVNVPSAVVATEDLVVTYQTEVKNGSVTVYYNGDSFTTGPDTDLSDGVAKITIPKTKLNTGVTSLYAVQTTAAGVKSVPADATLNFVADSPEVTFYDDSDVGDTPNAVKIVKVDSGDYIEAPTTNLPTKTGYTFAGWAVWTDAGTAGTIEAGEVATDAFAFGTTAITADTKLVPLWTAVNTVKVTFAEGAPFVYMPDALKGGLTVTKNTGTEPVPTAIPVRDGYVFLGWDGNNDGDVDDAGDYKYASGAFTPNTLTVAEADVVLTALWGKPATATVQFNKGTAGGLILQMPTPAKYDEVVGTKFYLPAEPYCEGYTFLGWDDDNNDSTPPLAAGAEQTVAVGGNTYTAVWQIKTTTVNYTDADPFDAVVFGTTTTTPVNYGRDVTFTVKVPAAYDVGSVAVLKDGALIGWTNKVETVGGSGKLEYTTLSYTFKSEGGTVAITLKSAEGVTFPVMMPTGSDFQAELDTSSGGYQTKGYAEVPYDGSYTFSVKAVGEFDLSSITVNGVDVMSTATVVDGVYTITVNHVTTKQLVEVKTTPKVFYTVTYILGTETFTTQRVEKNTELLQRALPKPTKTTGYNWAGWCTDDTLNTLVGDTAGSGVTVTSDVTLYGKRTPWTGTVKYDLVAGADTADFTDQTKTYGEALTLDTDVPTKEGYNFKGWATAANTDAVAYGKGAQFVDDTWLTEDGTAVFTLYAVWEEKTYTVSVSNGYDYTVHSLTSSVVEHNPGETDGGVYKFEVTVKSECAQFAPVVTVGTAADYDTTKANGMGTTPKTEVKDSTNTYAVLKTWPVVVNTSANDDGSVTYIYKLTNITADLLVNVKVTESKDYSVEIRYWNGTMAGAPIDPAELLSFGTPATTLYSRQWVEYKHYANEPVAPVIEGYTFEGWFKADGTAFDFTAEDNKIVADTTIYAKMVAITPKLSWAPASGDGWTVKFYEVTKNVSGNEVETEIGTNGAAHTYGSFIRIKLTVDVAYTVDNLSLTANGVLLGKVADPVANDADSDGKPESYTYTFEIPSLEEDTLVKILGIERKTVTVTYNANALDDVSGMPEQHEVVYYINGKTNSTISALKPVRTGYEFRGWNTDPAATTATHAAGTTADFTTDTTLYAIWKAVGVTASVEVTNATVAATTSSPAEEFEGEDVTLKATVGYTDGGTKKGVSTGKVLFYRVLTADEYGTPLTGALIDSVDANGTTEYTLDVKTSEFKTLDQVDKYYVKYSAEGAEGFEDSAAPTAADVATVKVMSKALQWTGDNKITFKDKDGNDYTGDLVAGNTYTLVLPEIAAVFAEKVAGTPIDPKAGIDYEVTWYVKSDTNDWTVVTDSKSDTLTWTDYKAGQRFRAEVNAIGATFAKEVEYKNDEATTLEIYTETDGTYKFDTLLYTKETAPTVLQPTTTDLEITGAVEEAANQVLFGATKFGWGNHLVQYENQTVTLKATVTDNATDLGVNSVGKVYFYRYTNDGVDNNDVLLNANGQGIEVGPDGIATMNYTMPDYDSTKAASDEENCSRIYAVYVEGVTYDTSASVSFTTDTLGAKIYGKPNNGLKNMVFSMSTTIKTPVIDSANAGTGGATSTTYGADLTDLLAGVEHTFTLRETGAGGVTGQTSDWSVVALDGRTVASTDYTIKWLATTGDNEEATVANGSSYTTSDNKVGDMFRVELVPTGDMKTGATSKYAKIGTKQDVNVTVTASDEITSTEVDRANGKYPDVYQLNEIKLTATVAAAEGANATVKPSGTVAFYYQDGTSWVYLGEAVLDVDTDGQMRASITTTKLPVDAIDNTKRDVTISVTYTGDKTFNEITDQADTKITTEEVTVYSSVVYVTSAVENVANNTVGQNHTSGIYIYAEEDKVLANETNVNLKLSDVYTLDHNPTLALSKLAYGVDYTVQWQQLSNAASYTGAYAADTTPWVNIDGATGVTCQIDVEDGAAYRAMITVNNTPIAKGSYTFVDQDINGRKVYYSNILVAADAPATVTVNVNTSNTADGYEGIVEGETVTIHTFASGASGTTPISELTTTVTKDGASEPIFSETKTNVNGHVSFTWDTAKEGAVAEPGYYTLEVVAKFTNGYDNKTITRTLIVRDDNYSFDVSGNNPVYNGKVQGLTVDVNRMADAFNLAADASVVVYYYTDENRTQQVEPTQAGTYYATIRLQESAYWTEKTEETTLTIKQREVSVVDLVAQAKVYDGTTDANIQEIILNDAETAQSTTGLPTGNTGVINGDSVYAIGTAVTNSANVNEATQVTVTVTLPLLGDDAANYTLVNNTYTEDFTIQRSQVKGDIADSTFQYTGSNITVPADDIYLIDQAGNKLSNYTVTYYYHNGDGVEQVTAMNKLGKYTVIARPEQDNYKGGASETVYVAATADDQAPDTTAKSALIDITNTVELYGAATGIQASATNDATITTIEYYVGGTWTTAPTDAGRYLVKVTASTGDTAYGIYTIVKANPTLTLKATGEVYNSAQYDGAPDGSYNGDDTGTVNGFPAGTYYTYTGGTIQGVAYEAPTEVGTYIVTAHVPETENYTAHEISAQFVIAPKALTITADSLQRRQYGAFPDMTASFDGLAGSAYAPDTSLRDVQIQPELIFNETDGYDNIAMDHVGNEYPIIAIAALARNYDVSYVNGNLSVTRDEPNPYLAIHGMIDNGNGGDIAYYGDVIQLYAYGSQMGKVINNSSVLTWSSSDDTKFPVTQDGLLTIKDVGTFTVTLTRGVGAQKISTTLTITALKKEVKVNVPDEDKVYTASEQTYNGTVTVEGLINSDTDAATLVAGNKRTNVGSQVVTYQVNTIKYQSEIYGGLFTINDKEVTINAVNEPGVVYGAQLQETDLHYTESGTVGTPLVDALTDGYAVSIRNAYVNLDVTSDVTKGYEILVAGRENINYNVKYVTEATDNDVEVVAKTLKLETGVINFDGRTSGYMKENDQYFEDKGFEVTGTTTFNKTPVDRMYGEVNPVMDYAFDALIAGDSEADLANLLPWLVEYSDVIKHNINGDANVAFVDAHLTGHKSTTCLTGMDAYYIDGMLGTAGVKNYTTTVTEATQNVYQRPVTLALKDRPTELDVYIEDAKNDTILLNIIKQNLEVSGYTYGGVEYGGLAEKLGHTMEDLQLTIIHKTVDLSGDYIVHVKVGNPNYWLSNTASGNCGNPDPCTHTAETFEVKIHVTPDSIKVVYNEPNALGWTSASVVMHKMPEDQPVDLSADSKVYFAIYEDKGAGYDYSGETKIRSGWMNRASQTGVWTCTYSRLTAGNYRIFAIPVGDYTIINSGNVPVPTYPNP